MLTSRRAAAAAGHRKYVTGEPCKHGHVAERFTSSGACTECVSAAHDRIGAQLRARPVIVTPGSLVKMTGYVHPDDLQMAHDLLTSMRLARRT